MPLIEIELQLGGADLDAWGDALLEAGALSVSAQDADADTEVEAPLYAEPGLEPERPAWNDNRVSVLFPEDVDPVQAVGRAARATGQAAPPLLQTRVLGDEDWVRRTQSQFEPVIVGRLAIVPSWHAPPEGAVVIGLDPGVAFGTGSHPTTRLCLAWLEGNMAPGAEVLDYGCGSGILGISAAALGAGRVVGVDIDAQAVQAARENARRNAVEVRLLDAHDHLPTDEPDGRFDIVVANILANPLVVLAPTLVRHLRPGGHIVLSGILARQAGEVSAAYAAACPGLALAVAGEDAGWVALAGHRPAER